MSLRKYVTSLQAECLGRGLPSPAPEVAESYAAAAVAAREAARALRAAGTDARQRRRALSAFTEALRAMLAVRRSVGLAGERRVYQGIRASRVVAAAALPADSIFSPLSPPPGFGRGKKNEAPN